MYVLVSNAYTFLLSCLYLLLNSPTLKHNPRGKQPYIYIYIYEEKAIERQTKRVVACVLGGQKTNRQRHYCMHK